MHADHSALEILAHVMIAFLFLFRWATALPNFADHAGRFRRLKVPFPEAVLAGGLATMVVGGLMVLLDFHAWIGALMLIVFTALANLLYHHFWAMDDPEERNRHLYIFCNNVAVMGGLVLVAL